MASRFLARATSRRLLALQLGAFALLLGCVLAEVAMVKAGVSCATYRRTEGLRSSAFVASLSLCALSILARLAGQLWLRRFKPFLVSLGLAALEAGVVAGVVWLSIDVVLFYCAFEGLELDPCLFGCWH